MVTYVPYSPSPDNPFKSAGHSRYTKTLFYETNRTEGHKGAIYTLKDRDHKGLPSLYCLYMALNDLTEYEFALKYFDGWDHWKQLCDCTWFRPFIARWREELDLRTKSLALRNIQAEANDPSGKNRFSANKILIDRAWEAKPNTRKRPIAGRPSNEEVHGELKRRADDEERINSDFERILGDNGQSTDPVD